MPAGHRAPSRALLVAALTLLVTSLAAAQGIEKPRVPLRTAINEINTLRSEYADLYNKKDVAALTAMYLPDAVLVRGDGSTVLGQAAIGKAMAGEASGWGQITLSSDTMRVFGNTAWDVGSMTSQGPEGDARASRYLVVLRRGILKWQVSSVAVVPERPVTATK